MKYTLISLLSCKLGFLLQVDNTLSYGTSWAIIVVLAGVVATLAIHYSRREKEREKLFHKMHQEHKDEIKVLTEKVTEALTQNKGALDSNTKVSETQTILIRQLYNHLKK